MPGLTASDLEQRSFYDILQERFGIEIVGGLQTIEPTVTNEEESEALGVPLHSPAFLFERTTRSATGEIVEYVRSMYRGDRYKLVTELNRSASSPAGSARRRRASGRFPRWSIPRCAARAVSRPSGCFPCRRHGKVVLTTLEMCAKVPTQ